MFQQVIPNQLLRGQRPGYGGERGRPVAKGDVDTWVNGAHALGINSIICLLAEDQLPLYSVLQSGLISYYREAGFEVAHIPVRDHQRPAMTQSDLDKVWQAYAALPKPVLVHCSAGIDRTGAAVRHILQCVGKG